MLAVIEIKASERAKRRLSLGEVSRDIHKLCAHREEAQFLGYDFDPVMVVVDSARDKAERMTQWSLSGVRELSRRLGVEWRYISPKEIQVDRPPIA
jgi:hypothetical protein